jgi:transposase
MPKPYYQDLRERVVRHVEAGHSRRAAAAYFGVSASFVINLMPAYRLRGSLMPKRLGGRRHAKLDPHREFLLRRVARRTTSRCRNWRANSQGLGRESRSRLDLSLAYSQRLSL